MVNILFHYLDKVSQGRKMVTETVLESCTREGSERIAFVFSFLLDKERTVEYFAFPELQCSTVFSNKVAGYYLLIEQIPLILIAKRADTLVV